MKLKSQVTSLELAKRLKELGVKQESLFYWAHRNHSKVSPVDLQMNKGYAENWSAFTVAELGEMIPFELKLEYRVVPSVDGFIGEKYHNPGKVAAEYVGLIDVQDKSEANARAKMLIYLLENKLI